MGKWIHIGHQQLVILFRCFGLVAGEEFSRQLKSIGNGRPKILIYIYGEMESI
jgi:hypothetical protein